MDRENLLKLIDKYLPMGVIMLEEPESCVLIHRDFAQPLIGYKVKFLVESFERTLFVSKSCRPSLHSASSLFEMDIPCLKNRCYFVMASRCKKVFIVGLT